MSIALRSGNGSSAIVEMNTTPLIDVLLVLLVMLILTIPIQTHAVKMALPFGGATAAPLPVIDLAVDFDGSVTWNGQLVPDRRTLDNYFAIEASKPLQARSEIRLRANRLAKYGAVAVVLADAQRAGVTNVRFANGEQYLE